MISTDLWLYYYNVGFLSQFYQIYDKVKFPPMGSKTGNWKHRQPFSRMPDLGPDTYNLNCFVFEIKNNLCSDHWQAKLAFTIGKLYGFEPKYAHYPTKQHYYVNQTNKAKL